MAKITVNGREITFPPEDPTMGEMADAENYFGVEWINPERSGMRITAAFLFIALKRVDKTVTVDDVRALDPAILKQLAGGDDSPPEETAPAEPSKSDSNGSSDSSSRTSSDDWVPGPSRTGDRGSDTTLAFDRPTSAT
jgi:hypothetical protein